MVFCCGSPGQPAKHPSTTYFSHSSQSDVLEPYHNSTQHSHVLPTSLRVRVTVLTWPGSSHLPSALISSQGCQAAQLPRALCTSYPLPHCPPHCAPAPLTSGKFLRHTNFTRASGPLHMLPSVSKTPYPHIHVPHFLPLQAAAPTSLPKRTSLTGLYKIERCLYAVSFSFQHLASPAI